MQFFLHNQELYFIKSLKRFSNVESINDWCVESINLRKYWIGPTQEQDHRSEV